MKKKVRHLSDLGPIQLWRLRKDICLNSLFLFDYNNRYGIPVKEAYDFFTAYLDFLEELMKEEIPNYNPKDFWGYIDLFDNRHNLLEWYDCWFS